MLTNKSLELHKALFFLILYLRCSKIMTNYYSIFLFLNPIATQVIFANIVVLSFLEMHFTLEFVGGWGSGIDHSWEK